MGPLEDKSVHEFENESLLGPHHGVQKAQANDVVGFSGDFPNGSFSGGLPRNSVYNSIKTVVFSNKLNLLMPFGPLAILVSSWKGHPGWVFFLSLLGITPLAERLGYATEQLAFYTGPTVGGLFNATFGNATELVISIYVLKSGMIRIVQLSLLGSILSNLLLVLGCAFFCGELVHGKEQVFNKGTAVVNLGLLLMAVMGLLFSGRPSLKSQNDTYLPLTEEEGPNGDVVDDDDDTDDEAPEISKWESVIWLLIMTAWISFLSEYLVQAIEGASLAWNMPISFISVILLPVVGNASEHASAIMFAMKDKLDISLGVGIGSSTQISMFGVRIPFCVVIGWIMGWPMDLNFQLFETATLFITVIVVAIFLQEGTSNYFKGLMLILCYLIVAASFFVHEDHKKRISFSKQTTLCGGKPLLAIGLFERALPLNIVVFSTSKFPVNIIINQVDRWFCS
ncbi:hypothetical protein ACFE04_025214 [Oxalis oulophora]